MKFLSFWKVAQKYKIRQAYTNKLLRIWVKVWIFNYLQQKWATKAKQQKRSCHERQPLVEYETEIYLKRNGYLLEWLLFELLLPEPEECDRLFDEEPEELRELLFEVDAFGCLTLSFDLTLLFEFRVWLFSLFTVGRWTFLDGSFTVFCELRLLLL
mgnify:CR=1 FL=1